MARCDCQRSILHLVCLKIPGSSDIVNEFSRQLAHDGQDLCKVI